MRFGFAKTHATPGLATPEDDSQSIQAAYERGRREERARHRRSPLLTLLVCVAGLVGGATMVLAALHGSFAAGGASLDRGLSAAAHRAGPALHDLTSNAGQGLNQITGRAPAPAAPHTGA